MLAMVKAVNINLATPELTQMEKREEGGRSESFKELTDMLEA